MRKNLIIIPLAFCQEVWYNIITKSPEREELSDGKGQIGRIAAMGVFSPCLCSGKGVLFMEEKRLAVLSIMAQDRVMAEKINTYLSEYGEFIVGRMGIPYRERGVFVLCIVLDAPASAINALTGKIGSLAGVSAKTLFGKI